MAIVQSGDPVLHKVAQPVAVGDLSSKAVQGLIQKMTDALRKSPVGIGLAAPQIGVSKAVFIVSKYVLQPEAFAALDDRLEEAERVKQLKEAEEYLVFINPRILKMSKKKKLLHEGCLSVRGKAGDVKRSTQLTVEAYDEAGKKFRRGAGGLLAHVIQHEVDHLHGILFVDKAEAIQSDERL